MKVLHLPKGLKIWNNPCQKDLMLKKVNYLIMPGNQLEGNLYEKVQIPGYEDAPV